MAGIVYRFVRNREDVEDVLQEAFFKVFKNIKSYRGEGSFEGWIKKIVVNTAINHLKKWSNFKEVISISDELEAKDDYPHDIENIYIEILVEKIRELPDGYRVVFELYAIQGKSHKEISQLLGISESTSKTQYTRGKQRLIKELIKEEVIYKNEKAG